MSLDWFGVRVMAWARVKLPRSKMKNGSIFPVFMGFYRNFIRLTVFILGFKGGKCVHQEV